MSKIRISRYGNPLKSLADRAAFEKKWMMVYIYPKDIAEAIPCLGKSVYINRDFQPKYEFLLRELIKRGLHKEINQNDQCFMPRLQRGSDKISDHTWATSIDLNPDDNPIYLSREKCIAKGLTPFTPEFTQCVRDCGLITGEDFKDRPDLMHIQMP